SDAGCVDAGCDDAGASARAATLEKATTLHAMKIAVAKVDRKQQNNRARRFMGGPPVSSMPRPRNDASLRRLGLSDRHALERVALANGIHHILSAGHLAEDGVLAVQPIGRDMRD